MLTGPDHAAGIAGQLPELPAENILVEPAPRGTAPCLGLAAMRIRQRAGARRDGLAARRPRRARCGRLSARRCCASIETAREGYLVTVGIVPTSPETGFGYIERGELLATRHGLEVWRVARFTEKPPLETAQAYVASGEYYWNSGYLPGRWTRSSPSSRARCPRNMPRLQEVVAHCGRGARAGGLGRHQAGDHRRGHHGASAPRGGGALRHGLERHGQLGRALRYLAARRRRQRA